MCVWVCLLLLEMIYRVYSGWLLSDKNLYIYILYFCFFQCDFVNAVLLRKMVLIGGGNLAVNID